LQLPKEKPSLDESIQRTLSEFSDGENVIKSYIDHLYELTDTKMKRGNDNTLAMILTISLIMLKELTHSVGANWRMTFILRELAFLQNDQLNKIITQLESKAINADERKDLANLKYSVMEVNNKFESIKVQFNTTKNGFGDVLDMFNELRRKATKFDKMEELADLLNEIVKERGGKSEDEQG